MAESSPKLVLDDVLEKLSFKKFYPEKLTREELYQITPESLSTEQREKSPLAWQFIYNLTRYNYHARNVKTSGTENVETFKMSFRERTRLKRESASAHMHPLDVLVAIFLCCDPTAKQDFIMHLWGCKLAMPFSLQLSEMAKPSVFLWPFRSLIGQFQKSDSYAEMQMIHKPMKCIAFIRAGENKEYSKSSLLNCLIGGSEKPHPIFFHRNSEGSKRLRSTATCGLVELGWYLPAEANTGRSCAPRLFVNLRGDALDFKNQIDLIGEMSTITIVLCTVQNLNNTKQLVQNLIGFKSRVILLISDQNPNETEIENYIQDSFEDEPDINFDVVTSESYMLSEILEKLLHCIGKMEEGGKDVVLSDIVKNLSNMKFIVDEAQIDFAKAFEYSKDIIDAIRCVDENERKSRLLPLQENFWKTYAQLDRNVCRFDQLDESEKKKCGSKHSIEKKMVKVRKKQFKNFNNGGISLPMKIFIKALSNANALTRKIFLRMLKLELDNISRVQLKPFYDKYQDLVNLTISATEEERISINSKLSELDEMKSKLSFGMEHVIRELGQLYEACESQPDQDIMIPIGKQNISYKQLPRYACLSLLEGYPVEILDGEACSVPILWVRAIFKELPIILKEYKIISKPVEEIRVHAISVLGIQSSGKSTFLNVMFGLQFAVSAGRCTRGAFMQLVKVQSSLKNEIMADFILAIDTEGLKAAELISSESVKHDNELSTFVIGLADTTVINLMGENATYLQENLPIAVHAFLRMNLVGLHPRCTIVHHNVDKRNKEKLLQQSRILESVLNNLTKKACELEKVPPRLFQEIIEFSIANHTNYVPSLFEGEQPMAPINIGYSKEAGNFRTKLVHFVRCDSETASMTCFVRHLENLWNAIKKDRFVYEFRTTLETEARLDIDKGYSRILLDFLMQVDTVSTRLIERLKSKHYTLAQVEERFSKDAASIEKKSMKDLQTFIDRPKKVTFSCFDEWKQKCFQTFQIEMQNVRESTFETFRNVKAQICPTIPMDEFEAFRTIMFEHQLVYEDFNTRFNIAFCQWREKINLPQPELSILKDTTEALQIVYPAHKYLLAEQKVETSSLTQFKPNESKHLNHSFHKFSSSRIVELLTKLQAIQEHIANKYQQELAEGLGKQKPYSNMIPKQILLRIEQSLSEELENFDKNKEISHMYSIDLLLCTSGTMVHDLRHLVKEQSFSRQLEEIMKTFIKKTEYEAQKSTDMLLEILFESIDTIIESGYIQESKSILKESLRVVYGKKIYTKQGLLGMCLFMAISDDNDKQLALYFHSPEKTTFEFLEFLLREMTRGPIFHDALRNYVHTTTRNICDSVCRSFKQQNISFDDVLKCIYRHAEIDLSVINFFKSRSRKYMKSMLNFEMLRGKISEKCDTFIKSKTQKCTLNLQKNYTNVLSLCALQILSMVLGCTALCPFCKEVCKFSSGHPGQHECFVHRPVGCRGMHWKGTRELSYETCTLHFRQRNYFYHKGRYICFMDLNRVYRDWNIDTILDEEISCVWKWIFVNKHDILRSHGLYELPKNMPVHWYYIDKKRVLRSILQQFDL